MLYFFGRNFRNCPPKVKETLYLRNIRPILEYACVLWDPRIQYLCDDLERVQNRAARFVTGNYDYTVRSSLLKDCLGWQPLKCRRFALRLKLFHNIYNNKTGINRESFLQLPHFISRRVDHQNKVREYSCRTNIFKHSFFPLTTHQWNCLPESLVMVSSNNVFFSRINKECLYLIS
uniref:Putative endonuclease/reverse transcriptase n=1 Tax=Ixodes ricinus TaxID=34613 RepID=A0A090XDI9_IXORI